MVYVGCTKRFADRMEDHARDQRWWVDIDLATIVTNGFATLEEAADFEEMMLHERQPRYNTEGTIRGKYRRYGSNAKSQGRSAA